VKTFLVTFGSQEFYPSMARLIGSAGRGGIDIPVYKTPEDLQKTEFFQQNSGIFNQRRGYGYWLWKPYYILECLQKADEGDVVIYSDAAVEIVASLSPLISIAVDRQPLVAFGVGKHQNGMWTKRDCFILLNCDGETYWNGLQWNGFFQLYKKNDWTVNFVQEWLKACSDPRIITDMPNQMGQPNLPQFRDHRHDQSVFSLLCQKAGLEKFRDPSQWGNFLKAIDYRKSGEFLEHPYEDPGMLNSPYGTLLNHHRERLQAK